MPFQRRSYWLAVGVIVYVCLGALPHATRPIVPLLGLLVLPAWLAEVWRRTYAAPESERRVEGAALSAVRLCHFGAALWVAARLGPEGRASHDAIANLGTGIAAVFALVALARIPSAGGLLTPTPSTRSLDAAGLRMTTVSLVREPFEIGFDLFIKLGLGNLSGWESCLESF